MPVFRFDVNRRSGEVMLLMETACGLKPIMGWTELDGIREFAEMLLDFYEERNREKHEVGEISDSILQQALGGEQ